MLRGVKLWSHLAVAASVVAMAVLAALGVVGQRSQPEKIEQLQVVVTPVGESGLRITETIDQDFGSSSRHGPELVVPNDFGMPTEVTASSPDAPDDVHVDQTDYSAPVQGTRIRVGDPDITVTGQHRYVIAYTLPSARFAAPTFSLDAVGADSEIPIEDVTVVFDGIELDSPKCTTGRVDSNDACPFAKGAPLRVAVDRLDPKEGITISGEVTRWGPAGEGVAAPAPPERRTDQALVATVAVALVGALSAGAVYLWARRSGANEVVGSGAAEAAHGVSAPFPAGTPAPTTRVSDAELAGMTTVAFAPPAGIEPWQGAVAVNEVLDQHTVTAWFSGAIANDVLAIEARGSHPRLRRGSKADDADPVTERVLHKLFGNRDVVDLNGYDSQFASAWSEVATQQGRWVAESGWWWGHAPKPGRGKPGGCASFAVLLLLLIPTFLFSAFLLGLLGAIGGIVTGLVFGAGVPALVARVAYAPLLPGRTANGSAYALQVESFRRFLVDSEAQYVDWAWKNGMLRQYSAWAVALDAAGAWEAAMERAGVPQPEIEASSSPLLVHSMASSFVSSQIPPSTSSSSGGSSSFSSGGFSGSVGGGGGGGSHGSW